MIWEYHHVRKPPYEFLIFMTMGERMQAISEFQIQKVWWEPVKACDLFPNAVSFPRCHSEGGRNQDNLDFNGCFFKDPQSHSTPHSTPIFESLDSYGNEPWVLLMGPGSPTCLGVLLKTWESKETEKPNACSTNPYECPVMNK